MLNNVGSGYIKNIASKVENGIVESRPGKIRNILCILCLQANDVVTFIDFVIELYNWPARNEYFHNALSFSC